MCRGCYNIHSVGEIVRCVDYYFLSRRTGSRQKIAITALLNSLINIRTSKCIIIIIIPHLQ